MREKSTLPQGIKPRCRSLAFHERGKLMTYYRLYFFRSETGHIREVREIEATHDFAAIQQSTIWRSDEMMELWSGSRRIARWPSIAPLLQTPVQFPALSVQLSHASTSLLSREP